jgi:phosphosulfolactate synthase (CoM biosynthesis protein A)
MASIDIEDILWDLSDREKQELVDDLYEDGFVAKKDTSERDIDDDWNEQVNKLFNNKWRLTKEDEETILRITNKLV